MAERSKVFETKIKHNGFFNYKDTYSFCVDWFKDNGYSLKEKEYTEKNTESGKDITLDWEADRKVTDYFNFSFSVKWKIIGMRDAEVVQEGRKISTNKGNLSISITVELVKDYEERWVKKPLWKFLRAAYDRYIIRTTIEEYSERAAKDGKEFSDQVKAFLNLGE